MEAFCTLFNYKYLSRALTMYESLQREMADFILYILALDDISYRKLTQCNLKNTIIISYKQFENKTLMLLKEQRSEAEYCWTCSSAFLLYIFEHYQPYRCTYIDADLYFFNSPNVLLNEMKDKASLITEHRFAPAYQFAEETSGTYCVQFMPFINNPVGLTILTWWYERCIECCSLEKSCGDQKYLNDWTTRFDSIHVLEHLGGGVAPWNVSNYTFLESNHRIKLFEPATGKEADLIFYHFHNFTLYNKNVVRLASYFIPDTAISTIYKQYIRELDTVNKKYSLSELEVDCNNREIFISDDFDHLNHQKNYYPYSLFI